MGVFLYLSNNVMNSFKEFDLLLAIKRSQKIICWRKLFITSTLHHLKLLPEGSPTKSDSFLLAITNPVSHSAHYCKQACRFLGDVNIYKCQHVEAECPNSAAHCDVTCVRVAISHPELHSSRDSRPQTGSDAIIRLSWLAPEGRLAWSVCSVKGSTGEHQNSTPSSLSSALEAQQCEASHTEEDYASWWRASRLGILGICCLS